MKYKKIIYKIILIFIITSSLISNFFPVNAIITPGEIGANAVAADDMKPFFADILNITGIIASAISIIVLICLGIKYMVGSVEQKATYKKTLLPYAIGALLVFGASTIAGVIYNMF